MFTESLGAFAALACVGRHAYRHRHAQNHPADLTRDRDHSEHAKAYHAGHPGADGFGQAEPEVALLFLRRGKQLVDESAEKDCALCPTRNLSRSRVDTRDGRNRLTKGIGKRATMYSA